MNIEQFLDNSPLPFYINGESIYTDLPVANITDPAKGEVLTTVCMGDKSHANLAVESAHAAFSSWRNLSVSERNAILLNLADLIEEYTPTLATIEARDGGKVYAQAESFDIPFGNEALRYYSKVAIETKYEIDLGLTLTDAKVVKQPYGVCSFVLPWNFPFALCLWGISPALASGNTVVIKPAKETPLSALFLCYLAEKAGVPKGVINVVVGEGPEVGEAIMTHPLVKRNSFTGSTQVGRRIGEISGRNLIPSQLELGGKGAAVIYPDVDIESVAADLCGSITMNTGQVCCTATRWYVHEDIFHKFTQAAINVLDQVVLGNGLDESTTMGPLCTKNQLKKVLGCIAEGQAEGAEILCGGNRIKHKDYPHGFYFPPTLLTGPENNPCAQEEIFGPIAYLIPFSNLDDVVEKVNRNPYGLANSVWSKDLVQANKVARELVAGNCWINAHNVFEYGLPYGACNQSGCGGGVNSVETFEGYLRRQTVASMR